MTKVEESAILTARIRGLQAIYDEAHRALIEWGLWSMDRRGIFPVMTPPAMWDQFKRSEVDDYGDETPHAVIQTVPAKAEGPEHEPYDEKLAVALDERLHGPGGLCEMVRLSLRTAYATREIPEYQFPRFSNCSTMDQFCERLETGLRFAGRFV